MPYLNILQSKIAGLVIRSVSTNLLLCVLQHIDDLIRTAILSKNIIEFSYHDHHAIAEAPHVFGIYMMAENTTLAISDRRPELFWKYSMVTPSKNVDEITLARIYITSICRTASLLIW